jgi:hypothetical protein
MDPGVLLNGFWNANDDRKLEPGVGAPRAHIRNGVLSPEQYSTGFAGTEDYERAFRESEAVRFDMMARQDRARPNADELMEYAIAPAKPDPIMLIGAGDVFGPPALQYSTRNMSLDLRGEPPLLSTMGEVPTGAQLNGLMGTGVAAIDAPRNAQMGVANARADLAAYGVASGPMAGSALPAGSYSMRMAGPRAQLESLVGLRPSSDSQAPVLTLPPVSPTANADTNAVLDGLASFFR